MGSRVVATGALVVLLSGVGPACHGNFPSRDGSPDADVDGDTDADDDDDGDDDGDADADDDADADGDADVDVDTDADGDPSTIVALSGSLAETGPYPAGTSVVVSLEPTWGGPPMAGVPVTILAEGGLVSLKARPGSNDSVVVTTDEAGKLPDVRVTFPLDPWPYEVSLGWRSGEMSAFVALDGMAESLEVVEPDMVETAVLGSAAGPTVLLPSGLVAEEYAQVAGAFDFGISDGVDVDLESLALAFDDHSSTLIVAGSAETCFFSTDLVPDCHQTRPLLDEGIGPDSVNRVAFYSSDDGARGLYLSGYCGQATTGGGLYSLAPDGTTERLVDLSNVSSFDASPGTNAYRPTAPPGIYFFGGGELRFYDPEARALDDAPCPSLTLYPYSITIADPEMYGGRFVFFVTYDDGMDTATIGRVTASCGQTTLLNGIASSGRSPGLRPGPGAVFGRMVYLVTPRRLQLLAPGAAPDELDPFVLMEKTGVAVRELALVDVALMPDRAEAEVHPAGLYVLDGSQAYARVLRISQDLD